MAELKTRETGASVAAFMAAIEQPRRRLEAETLCTAMTRLTGLEARMWGRDIVGFGRYRYRQSNGKEFSWFLTGFSPRKRALSVYIMPGFSDFADLMGRLGKHKTGVSCLYLNKLDDADPAVLEDLIARSVEVMRQRYGT